MLQLDSNQILTAATQAELTRLQTKINDKVSFADKAAKAQSLWDSKNSANSSAIKKAAFVEIRKKLAKMCVSVGICNYCEQSEANDIEHIYPKSFFPIFAFLWTNYLLACKHCNTALKLDKCFVMDSLGTIHVTVRGQEPTHPTIAFINPRTENPAAYMIMNTQNFEFEILDGLSPTDYNKADKTIEILALNTRDTLIATRRAAAIYFYQRIELLNRLLNAETIEQIHHLLTPYDTYLDNTKTLTELKSDIKIGFKKDILQHAHPSVWAAIKLVDSKVTPKWMTLFQQLPEVLTW
jgi:uncharacterized protein (TIGR02646 family)